MKRTKKLLLVLLCSAALLTCSRQVSRVETSETIDLSGRWNDTDSQLAASELTGQALGGAWIPNFQRAHNN